LDGRHLQLEKDHGYTFCMARLRAIDYLAEPDKHPPTPVCVVFGDDLFLRRQALLGIRHAALGGDDGDFSLNTYEGRNAEFRDVIEDLTTLAMFGGQRLVIVEGADDGAKGKATSAAEEKPGEDADSLAEKTSGFVSRWRDKLEDYVARPSRGAILVLDVKGWPSNTRLAKTIANAGWLVIDCSAPTGADLNRWLSAWAKQTHQCQITGSAAGMLVEMIGPELGLLDQELAKLALMVGNDKKISSEMVQSSVGGWRAKTTWDMLDLALDGKAAEALRQIDLLLADNQVPIGLLGQISYTLRRLAAATRLILQAESAGRRLSVGQALEQAGLKKFFLAKAERQLKRLTRHRGKQIYRWLLEADMDLKGESHMPPRLILERLIVRLAAPA
jgi:DNA polymerase III subunit delta